MTDLSMYSDAERKESVKDILNLGFVAQLEGEMIDLPLSQKSALKFQNENLTAAVSSTLGEIYVS